MALSPITPMPVQWQDVLVDLQPTSLYGREYDMAMINTTLLLQAPSTEEVIFALPAVDAPEQTPLLRVIGESAGTVFEFEETTFDEIDRKLFRKARRADQKYWETVRREAQAGISFARVAVKAGEQLVRFHYPQRVLRQADGVFEFRVLAPLASFLLNPSAGEITLAAALPRVQGRSVQLQQALVENPPGTQVGTMETASIAQRQFVGHYLRQDPLYRIRYTYA